MVKKPRAPSPPPEGAIPFVPEPDEPPSLTIWYSRAQILALFAPPLLLGEAAFSFRFTRRLQPDLFGPLDRVTLAQAVEIGCKVAPGGLGISPAHVERAIIQALTDRRISCLECYESAAPSPEDRMREFLSRSPRPSVREIRELASQIGLSRDTAEAMDREIGPRTPGKRPRKRPR